MMRVLMLFLFLLASPAFAQSGGGQAGGGAGGAGSFPLKGPDGTGNAPSYTFSGDATAGMYRAGLGTAGFANIALGRASVGDANATIPSSAEYIFVTALTAARTYTLPAASSLAAGRLLTFSDELGLVTSTNTATLQRAGADTIDGGTTTGALGCPYGGWALATDGVSKWHVVLAQTICSGVGSAASSADLNDVANIAFLNVNQAYTKGQAVTPTAGGTQSAGGTFTPDFSASNSVTLTFGAGNLTIANPTSIKAGQTYLIALTQDGVGSRTVTWGANFKWAGGTAPTLSTTASAKDILSFFCDTTTTCNGTLAVKGAS